MTFGELLINLLIGFISGGITSIVVTKYFKNKEVRELEQKLIREEYIEFKQYLHELRQYLNNIYTVWDVISDGEGANEKETKKSLNQLHRYLMSQPYNVTKDHQKIKLDLSSKQHLENINKSISEFMDFVSESLKNPSGLNQDKLVEMMLLLSIAMGKTRVTNIQGSIVTCDFI